MIPRAATDSRIKHGRHYAGKPFLVKKQYTLSGDTTQGTALIEIKIIVADQPLEPTFLKAFFELATSLHTDSGGTHPLRLYVQHFLIHVQNQIKIVIVHTEIS